jgi:pentatricopeptide repeat protein
MSGFAQSGQANKVFNLFRKMRAECVMPDEVTFLVLLTACSHAGLLEEGEKLFNDMWHVYHLTPTLEHHASMIDLFGRAGHFGKARLLLENLQPSDRLPLLLGILNACQKWMDIHIARWAFEQSIELDETCVAAYISMANIYAAAGMQRQAHEIETW